ncbi:hypothetical protein BN946_scf184985.g124 [Trametes cinnabarina]|uniref:Uncharacterized protein n=1 Tax=Pycnoporus cinnabarinus TaxID=5643 RepID=A0A060SKE1_PYCCI|nr:hypothetical protein BN946_scf184985.g124 [Trametes cinnabarina]
MVSHRPILGLPVTLDLALSQSPQSPTSSSTLLFTRALRSLTATPPGSDSMREVSTPPPPNSPVGHHAWLSLGVDTARGRIASPNLRMSRMRTVGGDPFRTPELSRTNSSRYSESVPPSYHSENSLPSYDSSPFEPP